MKSTKTKYLLVGFLIVLFAGTLLFNFDKLKQDIYTAIFPSVLVDLTNESRVEKNLQPLVVNPLLQKAAKLKADDMAKKGYFSHNSPGGETSWTWFDKVNYDFLYAGENLAVNFNESADVNKAWLNSPTHKENILGPDYKEIGIATAEGLYKGKKATYVVQMFGTPMPATKTAYLNEVLRGSADELNTVAVSSTWKTEGEAELYMAVKRIRKLQVNTAAFNILLRRIMALVDSNAPKVSGLQQQ